MKVNITAEIADDSLPDFTDKQAIKYEIERVLTDAAEDFDVEVIGLAVSLDGETNAYDGYLSETTPIAYPAVPSKRSLADRLLGR